ncbi:FIMAH domain-containing protein [Micromonospora sp. NPDC093277]|uniref:FIMAH domain-containing protein n=1 Tax=Micromonospora sp. NPDC093277 TaxID=3364291 RepID=UPI00380367A8
MLPQLRTRPRHRAMTDGRRLMWTTVAGAAVAVTAATIAVAVSGGGDDAEPPKPAPALAAPTEADDEPTVDVAVTEEASASASPSPSPSPRASTGRPTRPADLVEGMQTTINLLVRDRQLSRDAGEDLTKRLREVKKEIADGNLDKAREKLREFAEKLVRLRKKDRISSAGYDALAAGAGQLAQAMTNR